MKKIPLILSALVLGALIYSFAPAANSENGEIVNEPGGVEWVDWTTAVERNKTDKKAFLVDVYTYWCGWCKRMDKTTFMDPKVVKYVNENFHAIKLNAEQKESINFNGHEFKWVEGGRNGVHTLAYSLMDGRMSYPTIVYLNSNVERIMISPGFKQADGIMKELVFAAEDHYKTTTWDEFQKK